MIVKKNKIAAFLFCILPVSAFSAQVIDLSQQHIETLKTILLTNTLTQGQSMESGFKILNQSTDFKKTQHIRIQQTYLGYPVWGAEAVLHMDTPSNIQGLSLLNKAELAKATMSGIFYQNLENDLQDLPAHVFTSTQTDKAFAQAVQFFESQISKAITPEKEQHKCIIYVDDDNKAHWAFYITFAIKSENAFARPTYIIDAINLKIYEGWNEIKSAHLDTSHWTKEKAGGFGGNRKMGRLVYFGARNDLPALDILRNPNNNICYLANGNTTVSDYWSNQIVSFKCQNPLRLKERIFWDGNLDEINEGYSPSNDALYAGKIITDMYQTWYGIPPLMDGKNKPLVLEMVIHSPNLNMFNWADPDNAHWDPVDQKMYFGDGWQLFYPLTSLGLAAHEISHGFTEQHSGLNYSKQSGGLNEAFSDMAAQAAEFYANGKNSWQFGSEITREKNTAIRYMDEPTRDCYGTHRTPGLNCSLDNLKDYEAYIGLHRQDLDPLKRYPDVHFSSGIFNRAFYHLAKSPGWNVKKAFDVMVYANQNYWTMATTFKQAACGVLKSAKALNYDFGAVPKAFAAVDIDTSKCV